MKIVYDEGEKERVQSFYDKYKNTRLFYDLDREYSLNFKVTNPAIAQHVLTFLLHNQFDDDKFDIGIDVTSINFYRVQNVDDVKQKLYEMIDDIIK